MNDSEIDRLLRQETPEVHARPGLEMRIRASLRQPQPSRRPFAWIALTAAACLALLIALRPTSPPENPELSSTPPSELSTDRAAESIVPDVDEINPLQSEARALRNDAERTGRFLLDCLPSVAMGQK
ncbi:MAG: hypothetical protein AAGI48_05865 [Verrucomicrobiota bacterium]